MMNRRKWSIAVGAVVALFAVSASAQAVPERVNFNARLTDSSGVPVSGSHQVALSLFDAASGGTSVWSETSTAMFSATGTVSIEMGATTALTATIFSGPKLYLEITVDGTPLTPRVGVASVPYALRAAVAATATTATTAQSAMALGSLTEAQVQRRVTGTCPAGQAIRTVAADGTVTCETLAAADLTIGRVATNPGTSCKDIKNRVPSATDGLYLIDTDGSGGNGPFMVYCDMTRDGGGWTLFMRVWYQSGLAGNVNGVGNPAEANSPKGEPYKLPDATVNALFTSGQPFDLLVDQVGRNTNYSAANNEYVIVRNYTGTFRYNGVVAESTTATVFESFRAHDGAIAWRGRLQCGNVGGYGFNCYNPLSTPNPLGAPNPQGGLGCLISMGTQTNSGWHNLYQGETNTDTYIYICNGAQHTSSYSNVHRWWIR